MTVYTILFFTLLNFTFRVFFREIIFFDFRNKVKLEKFVFLVNSKLHYDICGRVFPFRLILDPSKKIWNHFTHCLRV